MNERRSETTRWSASPWVPALALCALAAAVYYPVAHFDFVNWDDYQNVVNNGGVKRGLSIAALRWAFTTTYSANYVPLTWLSHMADVAMFGMRAGGHHLVSLLWHIIDTLLLFFFLRDATGASGRSFWVAALFAVHPLHVESVAWISERKDVLSTAFWLLGAWAYVRYVRQPSKDRYVPVAIAFILGLLAKPMLVTFPLTLLLLDVWPLQRWPSRESLWALVREKLPLFIVVPFAAAGAVMAQSASGAVSTIDAVRIGPRLANALYATGQYLLHLAWPLHLSAIYPHPGNEIAWHGVVASAAAIGIISVLTLRQFRMRPYLAVGWLWFLGTLVPVVGLVQVGTQAWADRYTYVPYIGPFIAIVWLIAELADSRLATKRLANAAGCVVVISFAWLAHAQNWVWRDDASLFGQVVERFPHAFQGHFRLATYYRIQGRWDEAVASSRLAVAAAPDRFDGWTGLGLALQGAGRTDEALAALHKALLLNPQSSAVQFSLAQIDESLGHLASAEVGYSRALELNPLEERSLARLATILLDQGDIAGALPFVDKLRWLFLKGWTAGTSSAEIGILCARAESWEGAQTLLEEAVRENPRDANAWSFLGLALQRLHRYGEAVAAYESAIRLEPRMAGARFNRGVALLQKGDFDGAMRAHDDLQPLDAASADKLLKLIDQQRAR